MRRNSRKSVSEDKKSSSVSSSVSIKEQSFDSITSNDSIEEKNGVELNTTVNGKTEVDTCQTDTKSGPENGTLERETAVEL